MGCPRTRLFQWSDYRFGWDGRSLFTFTLWRSTEKLWASGEHQIAAAEISAEAALKSAKTAEDALIKLERPFVYVERFPYFCHSDTDRPGKYWYSIHPVIVNSGNTPTIKMTLNVQSELRDSVIPNDFEFFYKLPFGKTRVAPRGSITGAPIKIIDDDLEAVRIGEKFFYIWGIITYKDFFENTPVYTTTFCTRVWNILGDPFNPKSGPDNTPGISFEFQIDQNYNENT